MAELPPAQTLPLDASTRERLVGTAARMFLLHSFHGVSVNEICAEAGVQKGSFYHFFPSKTALALAIVEDYDVRLTERLDRHERPARGPVNKMLATVTAAAEIQHDLLASFGRVTGCPIGNLAMELASADEEAGRRIGAVLGKWRERLAGHCHDAAEVGLLVPGTDPDQLAALLIATMQGMLVLAKIGAGSVEDVPAAMRRVIESNVRSRPAA